MTFNYTFPRVDEFVLQTGLRVILIPDRERDGLVVALQCSFGRFCDPQSKEGTAELCIGLMQKGSGDLSSEAFSERMEHTGTMLFADAGEEHSGVGMRMLAKYEDELFPVFWNMITRPHFEQHEFERIRREMITALQTETADPGTIANRHFLIELAGREHPAGKFHSINSIKRISLADIKAFYGTYFCPQNCILAVAGNFDPDRFNATWQSLLLQWRNEKGSGSVFAQPISSCTPALRLIDKPDLTQASIVIGHDAPGEMNPHRNEIALANYILGAGNFSSRLMKRIRSVGGKTYGISSQIASERNFGAFSIITTTQNNRLREVLRQILDEFTLFCRNGITGTELENAKRFVIGNMAFQLEGINNIVEKILWLRFYDRPNSYIEQFDQMINSISVDSVNSAIKTCFSPEKLIIIVVGKKSEIASHLKEFGHLRHFHFRDKI